MIRFRELFLGGAERSDPAFRTGIQDLARLAVRIVGALEIAVPLLMLAAGIGVIPAPAADPAAFAATLGVVGVGVVTSALGSFGISGRYARLLTGVSIWSTAAVLQISIAALKPAIAWIDHYLLGYLTLVKLGSATLPNKPWQTLVLGLAVDISYAVFWWFASAAGVGIGFGWRQHLFTLAVSLGCGALSAMVYRQRVLNYYAHQKARAAETRLLISENAAEMGRLAAALSHELNSPIGVLVSAVDTLGAVARRGAVGQRWQEAAEEAHRAGRESADRLRSIVARMQRFTNLDRADVQSVDVNELLRDVVALQSPGARRKARIELGLQPLPRLIARPQQLSAVFSNLLGNAVDAAPENGLVRLTTEQANGNVEVVIADTGRGMTEEELANAFNPAWFRVSGVRMAAANWSLFSCRQIVQEHGGDIRIDSAEGIGTTVRVTLPADHAGALE